MFQIKLSYDKNHDPYIKIPFNGHDLLRISKLNKGCAFSLEERESFVLTGLLPHQIETLEQQTARMYEQFQEHHTNLAKNIYLNALYDYNETLFYKLLSQHLEEMLPIIYTPTVGEAVERFSLEHRKPRGLYISYPDRARIDQILDNRYLADVDLIVVTDGGAVLGIGDQGIGGINIAVAKLMVYTLCGGISPHRTLPIQLDVGTNNETLLNDPMYLGWRHERITGKTYQDFIESFVNAVQRKFPTVLLHWEDVGRDHARSILQHYRDKICTFNGDIQATGVVTVACILAGMEASSIPLKNHRIVIFGAGTAGTGIADQIHLALQHSGLSAEEASSKFWLIDKSGLLTRDSPGLLDFQKPYARSSQELAQWKIKDPANISLDEVVKNIHPTILIGCSAVPGAFTKEIIQNMNKHTKRPIIMPLSNPLSKSEATPHDLIQWTEGQAIIATGSPYPDVIYGGKQIRVAQCNNAFSFPGIGLGAIAAKARFITDGMLWAAAQTLSQFSHAHHNPFEPILPKLTESKKIRRQIALAVAEEARKEGIATVDPALDLEHLIDNMIWEARYYPYKKD
ncbi:MAG TPA: NAD-dependent malic enzyme [Gammaproteobacteria bacterium]|nr:NAD-dependent malic enzyme [Gammaproteobacteria bacterium]